MIVKEPLEESYKCYKNRRETALCVIVIVLSSVLQAPQASPEAKALNTGASGPSAFTVKSSASEVNYKKHYTDLQLIQQEIQFFQEHRRAVRAKIKRQYSASLS